MTVTILAGDHTKTVSVEAPADLSTLLTLHQMPFSLPCGGRKQCKKCRVIARGHLSPMTEDERSALQPDEIAAGVRLACMCQILGDAEIVLPQGAGDRILTAGTLPAHTPAPLGARLGAAIDIGTTTLAAYLYDLENSALLATASAVNPQSAFGADVISRLQKSHEGQGHALAAAIRQGLNTLLSALCRDAARCPDEIDTAVITGNTAMLYLLTEQPPDSLIAVPFQEDRDFGEYLTPAELALSLRPDARVYLTRCISAYVGGDITMSSMTAELFRRAADDGPCLLADIGTNGEMVLWHNGVCRCCSTAAGPTFEGAGIFMGMNARSGAISRVWLEGDQICSSVIGGGKATGICGSGLIDAVAVLLECGVVDDTGRMEKTGHAYEECICQADGKTAFRLPGTDVVLTAKDIRAVQLAKSAICAGMLTLLHEAGLDDTVVPLKIAGGFGSFIDTSSAQRIGLIPEGFAEKAQAIGNAAGMGACLLLLSAPMVAASESFAKAAETVELSTNPFFMDAYMDNMMFPE